MIPEELVKYGLTGISLALIYLVGTMVKQIGRSRAEERKMYMNHMEHNTAMMQATKDSTEANTRATNELTRVVSELKDYLLSKK